MFRNPTFLYHYNPDRPTYFDVDASKRFGFGAMCYYVKGDPAPILEDGKVANFPRTDIQVILFLSKGLTDAELRYWPTELEMAGLVWLARKTRHIIQACTKDVIVFIDHAAVIDITRKHCLTTTTYTDMLNLRLVRGAQYLD